MYDYVLIIVINNWVNSDHTAALVESDNMFLCSGQLCGSDAVRVETDDRVPLHTVHHQLWHKVWPPRLPHGDPHGVPGPHWQERLPPGLGTDGHAPEQVRHAPLNMQNNIHNLSPKNWT